MDLFVLFDFCSFGLWFVFWVLISLLFFGLISHRYELVLISLCVPWVDFSWVWVGYDFSILWVDFLWVWVVLISLFFDYWFLIGLGWFWFLCTLVDFSWIWILISQLFESGFWFLYSLCRPFVCNNITWSVTFQNKLFFFFRRYILSMRSQVLCLFVNAK